MGIHWVYNPLLKGSFLGWAGALHPKGTYHHCACARLYNAFSLPWIGETVDGNQKSGGFTSWYGTVPKMAIFKRNHLFQTFGGCKYPIIYRGFSTIQTVVGLGISEQNSFGNGFWTMPTFVWGDVLSGEHIQNFPKVNMLLNKRVTHLEWGMKQK